MGLTDFGIIFERPTKTYFSGEVINGQLVINLSSPKNFRKIKIELFGSGRVYWTESRSVTERDSNGNSTTRTVTDTYSNHETYVKQDTVLHNGPSLPPGIHYFPFSFLLPPNMPTSFESNIGQVRYFVKADIVRDWKWNHKVKQHLMINGILDLNMYPSAKHEGNSRDHKRLCCLCCKSGPISAIIATNRSGYVPGEMIGFNAEVDNLSNREMNRSTLQLVEIVKFKATTKTKTEQRVVAELRRGQIGPGTSDFWEGVTMRIPAVPPTNLAGNCSIIDVQYRLDFRVEPSGPAFDLLVSVPIIIGTIPLQQYIPTFVAPPLVPVAADVPPSYDDAVQSPYSPSAPPPLDQFKMYPALPPPTYNESVWGGANVRHQEEDEHTKGDFEFVPRYPTYNTNY